MQCNLSSYEILIHEIQKYTAQFFCIFCFGAVMHYGFCRDMICCTCVVVRCDVVLCGVVNWCGM